MNSLSAGIYLTAEHWTQIKADIIARSSEEACGIIAGIGNSTYLVIPVTNILHDLYQFRMDPGEELRAFQQIDDNGWDVLAIYHSHPNGIDHPSSTDYEELTFPGIIYLIWYQQEAQWECRAYLMQAKALSYEVPIYVSTNR